MQAIRPGLRVVLGVQSGALRVLWRRFGFRRGSLGCKARTLRYLSKGVLLPDTGLGYWLRGTPRVDNASAPHSLAFLYLNEALIP